MSLSKIARIAKLIEKNRVAEMIEAIKEVSVEELQEATFTLNQTDGTILPFDSSYLSLIHIAAFYDSTECLVYLLDNKIFQVDQKSAYNIHPLFLAICNSSLECITILLERGADPNYSPFDSNLTPLLLAARVGEIDILQILFEHKASFTTSRGQISPISEALRCKHIDCFIYLINVGIKLDEQSQKNNYTPLMWAITNDLLDAVPLLIQRGADVNAVSKKGYCPLYFAIKYRSLKAVKLLSQSPKLMYNIECANSFPIHWAAESCVPEILRLVIDHGTNINAKSKQGETAIAFALRFSAHKQDEKEYDEDINAIIETLKILVDKGLDFNTPRNDGSFPILEYVMSPKCNEKVLDYIFSVGIDFNQKCNTRNKETLGENILKHANKSVKEYVINKMQCMKSKK